MKRFDPNDIRNVGIVGHGGCGKTSLGEAMLYTSGGATRLGRVDDGTSVLDWEPEELKRQSSVSTGLASLEWRKTKVNLLDTPGDANFINDARNCLAVADTALLVVSAVGGVEVGTDKMWGLAEQLSLPTVVFINKSDRELANPLGALAQVQEHLSQAAVPLQLPIGKEAAFEGVVDVLTGMAYRYAADGDGKGREDELPADLVDAVAAARRAIVEAVAESDEALMERYFEEDDLPTEALEAKLPALIAGGTVVPVLFGAANRNAGVDRLMDLIVTALPSPLARGSVKGHTLGGEEVEVSTAEDGPFAAQVFKTVADPYAGRLTCFRVWRGSLEPDGTFLNTTQDAKERFGQILGIQGKKQEGIGSVAAGDIVAVAKLKLTKTGDSLCDLKSPVLFEKIAPMMPAISFAIKPKSKGDEEKVVDGLNRLAEEDPSLRVGFDEQARDILLSGMGQVHVEVVLERLKRKFGVEVDLSLPKVPYRETIRKKATGIEGKHKKQTGGRGQFAVCYVDMEPLPRGEHYVFDDAIFGGSIPRNFIPAVDKGIQEAMHKGPLGGFPVVDVKVRLFDGKFHAVDSSELAFKIAGSLAFKEAFLRCGPCLLEPVMNLEVVIPEECMGDVMGDVTSRRGKVLGMDTQGRYQVIRALIPMAEVLQYAPDLRSMTSGRGTFTMDLSHYEELPQALTEKVIAEVQAQREEQK